MTKKKQLSPTQHIALGIMVIFAAIYLVVDLYSLYSSGKELRGTIIEYVPTELRNGDIIHYYTVETEENGVLLKEYEHEKYKIGSRVKFMIADGESFMKDYDLENKGSFIEFILQDNWILLILILVFFGVFLLAIGANPKLIDCEKYKG